MLRRATPRQLIGRRALPMSMLASVATEQRYASSSTGFVALLDNWWFGSGTVASASPIATPESYVSWFDASFETVQGLLGVEAWALLMIFGGVVRLCTLYFSLYGERAAVRMQCALPSLVPAHNQYQRIYYNENSSALEVQQAATVLKSIRKQTYKAHGTSNLRTLAGLIATPIVLQGFYSVSKMCESFESSVGTSSFLWCAALGMPDPLCILPVVSCGLTLLNLELTLLARADLKKGIMGNLIWGGRVLCVCAMPAAAQFRSGVLLYWIGMSMVGLLQPILVRSTAFRSWFGIPNQPPAEPIREDLLQTRLILQAPYFSHLFETDNTSALSSVPANSIKPQLKRREPTSPPSQQSTSRRLSEEMASVEAKMFQSEKSLSSTSNAASPKKDGASFANSGWKSTNPQTLSTDDLIPDAFRGGKGDGK